MRNIMMPSEKESLEKAIDEFGLAQVIESLAEICREKVEHLATSWQESNTEQAKTWKRNAVALERLHSGLWRQSWERK